MRKIATVHWNRQSDSLAILPWTPKGASIAPFLFILIVVISGVVYGIWSIIRSHPENMRDVIVAANAVMTVPQNLILLVLQSLIIAVAVYLALDFIVSFFRRSREVEKEEEVELWWHPGYGRRKDDPKS